MDENRVETIEESGGGFSYVPVTTSTKRSRVINRDYVRRWALEYAKDARFHSFTRVSESFLDAIETAVKGAIILRVRKQPSRGKTLQ